MKCVLYVVLVCLVLLFLSRAKEIVQAPVVFMSMSGSMCGCIVGDSDYPTIAQCGLVDRSSIHEIIHVSRCR